MVTAVEELYEKFDGRVFNLQTRPTQDLLFRIKNNGDVLLFDTSTDAAAFVYQEGQYLRTPIFYGTLLGDDVFLSYTLCSYQEYVDYVKLRKSGASAQPLVYSSDITSPITSSLTTLQTLCKAASMHVDIAPDSFWVHDMELDRSKQVDTIDEVLTLLEAKARFMADSGEGWE